MTKEDRKITASVSHECWIALRIMAVQKEVSLQTVVKGILEKYCSSSAAAGTAANSRKVRDDVVTT